MFNFISPVAIEIVEQVEAEAAGNVTEAEAAGNVTEADGNKTANESADGNKTANESADGNKTDNATANEPPQFKEEALEMVYVWKGELVEYTSPTAIDPEGDDFNITMTESSEGVDAVFTRNNNKSFSLSFETDLLDPGIYSFTFNLNDSISNSTKTYTLEVEVVLYEETTEEKGPVRSNFVFDPNAYRSNKFRPSPRASAKSIKAKIEETIESEINLPRSQFKMGSVDVLG